MSTGGSLASGLAGSRSSFVNFSPIVSLFGISPKIHIVLFSQCFRVSYNSLLLPMLRFSCFFHVKHSSSLKSRQYTKCTQISTTASIYSLPTCHVPYFTSLSQCYPFSVGFKNLFAKNCIKLPFVIFSCSVSNIISFNCLSFIFLFMVLCAELFYVGSQYHKPWFHFVLLSGDADSFLRFQALEITFRWIMFIVQSIQLGFAFCPSLKSFFSQVCYASYIMHTSICLI